MFIQSFQFDLLFYLCHFTFECPPLPKICHVSPLFLSSPFLSIVSTSGLHRMIAPNFSGGGGKRGKILIQFKKIGDSVSCWTGRWEPISLNDSFQKEEEEEEELWEQLCSETVCVFVIAVQLLPYNTLPMMYTLTVVPFWYPFDSLVLHFPFCTFFPLAFSLLCVCTRTICTLNWVCVFAQNKPGLYFPCLFCFHSGSISRSSKSTHLICPLSFSC